MAVIKQDNFSEASDINIESHTSDVGGTWQGGHTTGQVEAATSAVECTVAGTIIYLGTEDPSNANYFVEGEGYIGASASTDRWGVTLRTGGSTSALFNADSYYMFRITGNNVGAVSWNFFKVESGIPGEVGLTGATSGTLALVDADDPVKIKCTVNGTDNPTSILLQVDQNIDGGGYSGYSTVSSITDTAPLSAPGNVGIYIRNQNARITWFNAESLSSGSVAPLFYHYRYNL